MPKLFKISKSLIELYVKQSSVLREKIVYDYGYVKSVLNQGCELRITDE